jgi:hypothetical protein
MRRLTGVKTGSAFKVIGRQLTTTAAESNLISETLLADIVKPPKHSRSVQIFCLTSSARRSPLDSRLSPFAPRLSVAGPSTLGTRRILIGNGNMGPKSLCTGAWKDIGITGSAHGSSIVPSGLEYCTGRSMYIQRMLT